MNYLPIIGWILSFVGNCSLAIPFWFGWTFLGIGAKYCYWLPETYQSIPFWDCVWIFIVISVLNLLIPKFVYVSQSNENK